MIQMTTAAIEKVREFISSQAESFEGVRVAVVPGGCSGFEYRMKLERAEQSGDQVLDISGVKVFVDEKSKPLLNGIQIDFVENIKGSGFSFTNPNAKGTCGCGESFHA